MSDSVTPWTVANKALLSVEFSRQEYWSELPFPFPGDFPNPRTEPGSPALQVDSLLIELQGEPNKGISKQIMKFKTCLINIKRVQPR